MRLTKSPGHAFAVAGAFFFFYLLLIVRGGARFFHPQMWAEDGDVFLSQALAMGPKSLWQPYAGYFHLWPRLIAYFQTFLPLSWAATFFSLGSAFVLCVGYTRILSAEFSDLLPTYRLRALAVFGLFMSGGFIEGLGNVTNLHWFLTAYLFLLSLRNLNAKLGLAEQLFIFVAGGTCGASAVLIPLYGYRWWLKRSVGIRQWDDVGVMLSLAIWTSLNLFIARDINYENVELGPLKILATLQATIWNYLLLQPWVGDLSTAWLSRQAIGLYWLLGAFLLGAYIAFFARKRGRPEKLLLAYIGTAFLMLILMWRARTGLQGIFAQIERAPGLTGGRHGLVISTVAFMAAFVVVVRSCKKWAWGAGLLFVVLYSSLAIHRFWIPAYQGEIRWLSELSKARVEHCASGTEAASVAIPISPPPTVVTLSARVLCSP